MKGNTRNLPINLIFWLHWFSLCKKESTKCANAQYFWHFGKLESEALKMHWTGENRGNASMGTSIVKRIRRSTMITLIYQSWKCKGFAKYFWKVFKALLEKKQRLGRRANISQMLTDSMSMASLDYVRKYEIRESSRVKSLL